mgnify:CR=1 FL=1
MARDIAFVAEKDTPEEAGETLRDPRSLPEAPGPEGTLGARDASPAAPAPATDPSAATLLPPETPDAAPEAVDGTPGEPDPPLEARAPEPVREPPAESGEAASLEPPEPAEQEPEALAPVPAAEPDAGPGAPAPEQNAPAPRTEAVERIFAEAGTVPEVIEPAGRDAEPAAPEPALPPEPASPEPAPVSAADAPEHGHGHGQEETPDEEENNSASFTSAVEDLFRPSETSSDDTHLITTGRRFNPALSVPKPASAAEAAAPPVEALPSPAIQWKRHLWTGARYLAYAVLGYLALVLLLIVLFRFVNPPGSMLILSKLLGGTAIDRTWVPFEAISPALARAVIVAEDSRFCTHRGIDMQAMRLALEQASRGAPRGASTISMQVTKNLFLWNAQSYVRKAIELPLTLVMEVLWPKKRILEVYLNVAEWGPGVFGAEAAARHHFAKPASKLTEREAALLAAALPNPAIRVASNPGPRTSRMARVIQARVRAFGSVARCVVPPAPPTPPAAAKPRAPAKTNAPARKSPPKKQQQKQESDQWAPTLRFGP